MLLCSTMLHGGIASIFTCTNFNLLLLPRGAISLASCSLALCIPQVRLRRNTNYEYINVLGAVLGILTWAGILGDQSGLDPREESSHSHFVLDDNL